MVLQTIKEYYEKLCEMKGFIKITTCKNSIRVCGQCSFKEIEVVINSFPLRKDCSPDGFTGDLMRIKQSFQFGKTLRNNQR